MKKMIPVAIAAALLSGCMANNSQEMDALTAKVKDLEVNQRIIASSLKMQSLTGIPNTVEFGDGISFGDPSAPIAVIEFTDIQCPFCEKFQKETFPEFKEKYIDTGIVYYVAREMPLVNIHAQAFDAAVALRCAAKQDKNAYEEMKTTLFSKRKELSQQVYTDTALSLNLNEANFSTCLASEAAKDSVNLSYKYAISMGISSTPSFIFGHNTGYGAENFRIGNGALSIEQIDNAINLYLPQELEESTK